MYPCLGRSAANIFAHLYEITLPSRFFGRDNLFYLIVHFAVERLERKVLKFIFKPGNTEPVRKGRINVQALRGDGLLAVFGKIFKCAHAV